MKVVTEKAICMEGVPGRKNSKFKKPQGENRPGKNQARRREGGRKSKQSWDQHQGGSVELGYSK